MQGGALNGHGSVSFEQGTTPDQDEIRAAQILSNHGYNVRFLLPANAKGVKNTQTADTFVDGLGMVEIYTPTTRNEKNIANTMERKKNQASTILLQTNIDDVAVKAVLDRFWGKPTAVSVKSVIVLKSDGRINLVHRPIEGG